MPWSGKSAPHAPETGSRVSRWPERGSGKRVLRVRSTQLCVPSGISCWNVPSPSGARVEPCYQQHHQPKHSLCCSSSSKQMGWELPPLQYSMGMDNFRAVLPELWQLQLDVPDSLCNTCRAWQAPAVTGMENQGVTSTPIKNHLTGFPRKLISD